MSFFSAEAERVAKQLYGLDAIARALPGEFDDNFHLTASGGAEYTLKIMRAGCERSFLDLQSRALEMLAGLPIPRTSQPFRETQDGRLAWLLEWLPGRVLAEVRPHPAELLQNLGRLLGAIDAKLENFSHPAALRELKWDLGNALWIQESLHVITDPARRALLEKVLSRYRTEAVPAFAGLRRSVIHGDANDYNVLTSGPAVSLIDFGDLHFTITIAELAVACAYAALGEEDPLAAMAHVVRGYHQEYPLQPPEIAVLFPLIAMRLAVSVVNSALQKLVSPGDSYVVVSEDDAWRTLETLTAIHPRLAHYTFRHACDLPPVPHTQAVVDWMKQATPRPVVAIEGVPVIFDLSSGSLLLGADPSKYETGPLTETLFAKIRAAGANAGIGRYNEARPLYTTPAFAGGPRPIDEHRTIHLGLDIFAEPGAAVYAPFDGYVHAFANNKARLDYGPVMVLRHETPAGVPFFTLYGHLSPDTLEELVLDQPVAAGQRLGSIGAPPSNGDWPPHLHLQIIMDLLDLNTDYPGVAFASQREVFLGLSPDPNLIARIPGEMFPPEVKRSETHEARRAQIGGNLRLSYPVPLKIVRGWRQYLYDETGRAYLDVYNNVPLVGHSHPRVVDAVARQIALINTNTRYLHDNLTRYAARLTSLMPAPLRVCYFLNSASEATELALRLARTHTGREDVIVLEHAYHGHTSAAIDISPYKFDGPGGKGRKPWVHVAPLPDPYRREDSAAATEYAEAVEKIASSCNPAAYIAESLPSVGGQVVFPPGYLAHVYGHVRARGGVCIADEVQVGFGRLGEWFWGFESQNVIPDIVVLGKPMGNGFPLAGVVTTAEIAASFDNGMEFFSTYGGNPVACAAGLAVLDVLEEEGLQENARVVGEFLLDALSPLNVEDVRGHGLFLGVELATGERASYVVNRLLDLGILAGTDGPKHNVLKIRPPLIFSKQDAGMFVEVLRRVLDERA